ncbi:MAG: fibrobacter succinogenes major paralogous domain-containing protein [Bacteroidales bacterium]|nr:fibrobacter succinogenes major paralogous domain-containing protein [Bacteroidales bacterium]
MKKITLTLILVASFATQSFAYCPIPQWCPDAPLHQILCPGESIDDIVFPSVIAKTLIVTWWTNETRIHSFENPPPGITVSGDASTPLGDREYAFPVSIKGAPTNAGTYHYTVSNTCGVELLHGSITLAPPIPATPGTIAFSNNPVCTGAEFTASIAAVSGAATYNWTVPGSMTHDGSDGTTIDITNAGTTTGSLAISVTASNACGTSAPSTQNITVNAAPTIGNVTPTGDQTTTQNVAFASTLTVSPLPAGTPTPTIQWYSSTSASSAAGTSGTAVSGATGNTFDPPNDVVNTDGVFYYAVATNSCGTATTANTSGKHIVTMPPPRGCDFVNRDSARILSGGPVTDTVWTIPARAGVASQTWSDLVVSPQCNKTAYNGGSSSNFISDCRNNSTLVGATNAFPGHYFSWCAVMQYADILCPGDWRVPTAEDFQNLFTLMGGTTSRNPSTVIDGQSYTSGTNAANTAATHVPRGGTWGGSRFTASASFLTDERSSYWSSSEQSIANGFVLTYAGLSLVPYHYNPKNNGFALRCVRDVP